MYMRSLPQLSKKCFFNTGFNVDKWLLEYIFIFKSIILNDRTSVGHSHIRYQFSIDLVEIIQLLDKLQYVIYSAKEEQLLSLKNLCDEIENAYQNVRDKYVLSIVNKEISGLNKQVAKILNGEKSTEINTIPSTYQKRMSL